MAWRLDAESPLSDGTVSLRLVDERDGPLIDRASRDPSIANRFGLARRAAGDYIAGYQQGWNDGTAAAFAISEVGRDAVGQILLERRESGRADVGYWLVREGRGRGLASRSLRLVSRWALRQDQIARLQLWATPENAASLSVAERSGFKREGVLRSYTENDDGHRVDAVFFSLISEDLS